MLAARVEQKNGPVKSKSREGYGSIAPQAGRSRNPDHSSRDLTAPRTEHHDAQAASQQRAGDQPSQAAPHTLVAPQQRVQTPPQERVQKAPPSPPPSTDRRKTTTAARRNQQPRPGHSTTSTSRKRRPATPPTSPARPSDLPLQPPHAVSLRLQLRANLFELRNIDCY